MKKLISRGVQLNSRLWITKPTEKVFFEQVFIKISQDLPRTSRKFNHYPASFGSKHSGEQTFNSFTSCPFKSESLSRSRTLSGLCLNHTVQKDSWGVLGTRMGRAHVGNCLQCQYGGLSENVRLKWRWTATVLFHLSPFKPNAKFTILVLLRCLSRRYNLGPTLCQ